VREIDSALRISNLEDLYPLRRTDDVNRLPEEGAWLTAVIRVVNLECAPRAGQVEEVELTREPGLRR
jgi:hypothetical protein